MQKGQNFTVGWFFVESGTNREQPEVQLMHDGPNMKFEIEPVSSLFSIYLVASDLGDTLACTSDTCAEIESLPAPVADEGEEEGCGDPSPRQCAQTIEPECVCEDTQLPDGTPLGGFLDNCHNNIQGAHVTDSAPGTPWVVWSEGQAMLNNSQSNPIVQGAPAKVTNPDLISRPFI
eukprot:scaffold390347_cov42-Prasinocladus_malaysianus.AAC.1